ncbi:hypothetical protein PFISCL1PPCAC_17433, partial [Pristionchus fissidentatus]
PRVAMEPHGAEEDREGDDFITLHHRRIDFIWSKEECSYRNQIVCANDDVLMLIGFRSYTKDRAIVFY